MRGCSRISCFIAVDTRTVILSNLDSLGNLIYTGTHQPFLGLDQLSSNNRCCLNKAGSFVAAKRSVCTSLAGWDLRNMVDYWSFSCDFACSSAAAVLLVVFRAEQLPPLCCSTPLLFIEHTHTHTLSKSDILLRKWSRIRQPQLSVCSCVSVFLWSWLFVPSCLCVTRTVMELLFPPNLLSSWKPAPAMEASSSVSPTAELLNIWWEVLCFSANGRSRSSFVWRHVYRTKPQRASRRRCQGSCHGWGILQLCQITKELPCPFEQHHNVSGSRNSIRQI